MGPEPKVRESAEDYLEAMLMLKQERGYVRAVDVANHLGVTKPSVSYATKRLKEEGHLYVDEYGMIQLTDSGLAIAKRIYERHTVLAGLFESLGVSPEVALEDACKVEHDLSEETFAAIKKHAKEKGAI
ncbi:MAG: metal-dependent transcriptional regulator [Eubacterium sp.]|nr:metal-dependent transcriptional regulator [Eubacterium sp.]